MDDLISRQAAIDAIEAYFGDLPIVVHYDMLQLIKKLPSAERWIPVTERLPRECERVIGYMAWNAMTAIEYQHGRWYSIDHLEPLPDEAVSHWMPLPKPPKEGEYERT